MTIDYYALAVSIAGLALYVVASYAWFKRHDIIGFSYVVPSLYTFCIFLMIAMGVIKEFSIRTNLGRGSVLAFIAFGIFWLIHGGLHGKH